MVSIKKVIYFLLACDEKQAVKFLHKYNYFLEENKHFPKSFIRRSKQYFERNKEIIHLTGNSRLLVWRRFCKNGVYEQILPLLLFGILKYSKEKISLYLRISPEIVSYRLNEGLSILAEELLKVNSKIVDKKGILFSPVLNKEQEEQTALVYCRWLAEQKLSDDVEQIKFVEKYKKGKYLLGMFVCLAFLALFFLLFLVLSSSSPIILYQSFPK